LCLEDIKDYKIQPIIGIEPIGSPTSKLERHPHFAQEYINSLVNVFRRYFQPSSRQRLMIYLAIPWHRYKKRELNLPQKTTQYKINLKWTKSELRDFINKRISYEFKRVKRIKSYSQDPWELLFEKQMISDNYAQPMVFEESFDYILRYTHYRPRELQRLARESVISCAKLNLGDPDDVLRGTGGIKISGEHIRKAIENVIDDTAEDLLVEAERRFPQIKRIQWAVRGVSQYL